VLIKDFSRFAQKLTDRIKQEAYELFGKAGRPIQYLSLKERPEGVRLRHTVNGNSLKMYDKYGNLLRLEATVIHPEEFKVYRPKEGDSEGPNAAPFALASLTLVVQLPFH
jgi:hypothetical protein